MSLFEIIQSSLKNISESKKRVAYYILDNWLEAAFTTASKVAREAEVSESVVIRYSQDLGFTGFPELQKDIQKIVKNRLSILSDQDDSENLIEESDINEKDFKIKKIYQMTTDNLNKVIYHNSIDSFFAFKEKIFEANKILIIARQNSYGAAYTLNTHINDILGKSIVLNGEMVETLDSIRGLTSKDLVIFISIPIRSSRMENYSNYIKERKIPQIAITDNHSTDIGKNAETLLYTKPDSLSFANSHVTTLFIIDILIYIISLTEGATVFKNIEEIKMLNERFGISKY